MDDARAKQIFLAAIDLPESDRAVYLDEACAGDATLRRAVDGLIAAHARPPLFDSVARAAPTALHSQIMEKPGNRVGKYKLLERIGEGGFGEVWVAEQDKPVRRKVALKIVKAGMDTREVLARFEAERQALAVMDHPNVARVFDAGATDSGRPFFVMEHVPGVPITAYCDSSRMKIKDRLGLFIDICQAVQHAHQKGIIHRDLKPSNILVTLQDGKPVPKVIDFGIAKAAIGRLTERTLYTETGRLIGTPEYMSPEQAGVTGLDVDTRSDVYSLGVLLYQLLTGTLPFDAAMLREAGFDGLARIIKEQEPPKPSTRVVTLATEKVNRTGGVTPETISRSHDTDIRSLGKELRGDLDWIVMRAMEKDRTRRYESASAFAADVRRHLTGEPVVAAPPSAAYRVRKFVRKHRGQIVASSLVVMTLALGTIAWRTWWQLRTQTQTMTEQAELTKSVIKKLREELGNNEPEEDLQLRAKLASVRLNVAFNQTPFDTALEEISKQLQAPFVVGWDAMEFAGLKRTSLVTATMSNMVGEVILLSTLQSQSARVGVALSFIVKNGTILISTVEDLSRYQDTRSYPVDDILDRMNWPPMRAERILSLTQIVQQMVDPESWMEAGGNVGSISEMNGKLVVLQSVGAHPKIRALLNKIRSQDADRVLDGGTPEGSAFRFGKIPDADRLVGRQLLKEIVFEPGDPLSADSAIAMISQRSGVLIEASVLNEADLTHLRMKTIEQPVGRLSAIEALYQIARKCAYIEKEPGKTPTRYPYIYVDVSHGRAQLHNNIEYRSVVFDISILSRNFNMSPDSIAELVTTVELDVVAPRPDDNVYVTEGYVRACSCGTSLLLVTAPVLYLLAVDDLLSALASRQPFDATQIAPNPSGVKFITNSIKLARLMVLPCAEQVGFAVKTAQDAVRQRPNDGPLLNTLGIALFRAGRYEESLTTLTQSAELNLKLGNQMHLVDWAFIAMCEYHLGRKADARASFDKLREFMKTCYSYYDYGGGELQAFFREAEELIEVRNSTTASTSQAASSQPTLRQSTTTQSATRTNDP